MLPLPPIGFGCAALGAERGEGDDVALAVLHRALERGIAYFDTSPLYGSGRSEELLGRALEAAQGVVQVSSKVGYRTTSPYGSHPPSAQREQDFSASFVGKSLECSLRRLRRSHLDLVLLHDPDTKMDEAFGRAWPVLEGLRREGVVGAIGIGTNSTAAALAALERADLDAILVAGRYTLLDRSAAKDLLPRCRSRGVKVILAGVFNSGLLAGRGAPFTFDYAQPSAEVRRNLRALEAVCDRHGISLKAAALRFVAGNADGATMLVGPRSRSELDEILDLGGQAIPAECWSDLAAAVEASGR
ncbi:MAG: aldo/keto reductase [Microvirga sp.]